MSHMFYTCAVPHHGNCEGWWSDLFHGSHLLIWSLTCFIRVLSVWSHLKDDMLYSRWTCHELWCSHVLSYVCIPHDEYARRGYTPFKRRVSEVGRYPCNGLTNGYCFYKWMVLYVDTSRTSWHGRFFLQVHNSASLDAKGVPSSSRLVIIGRDK
jgi:hypothetical protein